MRPRTRRRLIFLAGFALYFVALFLLWSTPVVYPLKIFVVLLHEISHGAVAVATGGTIQRITLDPYQGGVCYCPGGSAFLTLSAGYLGSLGWGGLLLGLARSRKVRVGAVAATVGGLVLALTALYVRSPFGIGFGVLFGLGMVLAGTRLGAGPNRILVTTLGLTSCLYAVLDIKSDVLDRPHLPSDAAMLAELTGVPTVVWGVLWIGLALWVSARLFGWAWARA